MGTSKRNLEEIGLDEISSTIPTTSRAQT